MAAQCAKEVALTVKVLSGACEFTKMTVEEVSVTQQSAMPKCGSMKQVMLRNYCMASADVCDAQSAVIRPWYDRQTHKMSIRNAHRESGRRNLQSLAEAV